MKIAILTPTFMQFSGIDRVVEMQAADFIKEGHQVTIFCLKGGIKTKANVVEFGMPKTPFKERLYRLFFFLYSGKIESYAKKLKGFDLAIAHLYPMTLIAAKAKEKYGIKYVFHNHGVGNAEYNFLEYCYIKLFEYFTYWSIGSADYVQSISKYEAKVLERDAKIKSRFIVPNKIDTKRFHKGVDGRRMREKYGITNEPVMLYVGRISPHKGIHLLIESFKLVKQEFPKAKLIIVGKFTFGKYAEKLKKMATRDVIFAGFVPDEELAFYYAACDVYTTASLWEGFNLTIAEANAVGKPAVAFDLAAHPETIKRGILVKPKDTKAFANAVIKLLKDEAN